MTLSITELTIDNVRTKASNYFHKKNDSQIVVSVILLACGDVIIINSISRSLPTTHFRPLENLLQHLK